MARAVFLALTSGGCIWRGYEGVDSSAESLHVPVVLMMLRWDGCFGFFGGHVEDGESLEVAVAREFEEESGSRLTDIEISSLECISEMQHGDLSVYLMHLGVELDRLKCVMAGVSRGQHYFQEVMGVVAVPLLDYSHKDSLTNFKKGAFAPTVLDQLEVLISHLNKV